MTARRRNPSLFNGQIFRTILQPYGVGALTSAAMAGLDMAIGSWRDKNTKEGNESSLPNIVSASIKFGGAFLAAHLIGKRMGKRQLANDVIVALGATTGYGIALEQFGGKTMTDPESAKEGLANLSERYPEMGILLTGGLSALLEGVPDVVDSSYRYQDALLNTAGPLGHYDYDDDE